MNTDNTIKSQIPLEELHQKIERLIKIIIQQVKKNKDLKTKRALLINEMKELQEKFKKLKEETQESQAAIKSYKSRDSLEKQAAEFILLEERLQHISLSETFNDEKNLQLFSSYLAPVTGLYYFQREQIHNIFSEILNHKVPSFDTAIQSLIKEYQEQKAFYQNCSRQFTELNELLAAVEKHIVVFRWLIPDEVVEDNSIKGLEISSSPSTVRSESIENASSFSMTEKKPFLSADIYNLDISQLSSLLKELLTKYHNFAQANEKLLKENSSYEEKLKNLNNLFKEKESQQRSITSTVEKDLAKASFYTSIIDEYNQSRFQSLANLLKDLESLNIESFAGEVEKLGMNVKKMQHRFKIALNHYTNICKAFKGFYNTNIQAQFINFHEAINKLKTSWQESTPNILSLENFDQKLRSHVQNLRHKIPEDQKQHYWLKYFNDFISELRATRISEFLARFRRVELTSSSNSFSSLQPVRGSELTSSSNFFSSLQPGRRSELTSSSKSKSKSKDFSSTYSI